MYLSFTQSYKIEKETAMRFWVVKAGAIVNCKKERRKKRNGCHRIHKLTDHKKTEIAINDNIYTMYNVITGQAKGKNCEMK